MSLSERVPLLAELADTKRVRMAGRQGSLAEQAFRRSWSDLVAGAPVEEVAWRETAALVAACRAGALDAQTLGDVGLDAQAARALLVAAIDEVAADRGCAGRLRDAVGAAGAGGDPPALTDALEAQPRAGATRPGRGRLVLEPPESHADHCMLVGVFGVLLADREDADAADVFLAGLAHHLHNVHLPDAGFTGEALLGDQLPGVVRRCTDRVLATLPTGLAERTRALLDELADDATATARTFHTADVLDRVLQQRHYARTADFTLDQALGDLELVHPGPVQALQLAVLDEAGLWTSPVPA